MTRIPLESIGMWQVAWLLGRNQLTCEQHDGRAVTVDPGYGCRPVEGMAAQNRAGTSYRRSSNHHGQQYGIRYR